MEKSALKNLELSEQDFDLLVEGLEVLPNKNMGGRLFARLIGGSLIKDDDKFRQWEREMESQERRMERENQLLKENIRILQGKLLTMKRIMRENQLLTEAANIINKEK